MSINKLITLECMMALSKDGNEGGCRNFKVIQFQIALFHSRD